MRYRPVQYAEALHEAMSGKKEPEQRAIARRFGRVLARHRVFGKTSAILAAYEKLTLCAQGTRKVRIESTGFVPEQLKKKIQKILGKKIQFEEKENPELLAGVKILINDELLIDASARRQLKGMLRKSRI